MEYLVNNQSVNVNQKATEVGKGRTPLHLAVMGCMKRRNKNFTATVSNLLELKANPDVKEINGETAKVFAEKKIDKAVDYSYIDTYDYYYFKDEFSNCDCASTKRSGDYDVIDIDWENCYGCDAPCYFDWPSITPGGS